MSAKVSSAQDHAEADRRTLADCKVSILGKQLTCKLYDRYILFLRPAIESRFSRFSVSLDGLDRVVLASLIFLPISLSAPIRNKRQLRPNCRGSDERNHHVQGPASRLCFVQYLRSC